MERQPDLLYEGLIGAHSWDRSYDAEQFIMVGLFTGELFSTKSTTPEVEAYSKFGLPGRGETRKWPGRKGFACSLEPQGSLRRIRRL